LEKELDRLGVGTELLEDDTRPTILKQRTLAASDGRYHFRKDFEQSHPIAANHTQQLLAAAQNGYDLYIVSDYAKGTITQGLVQGLIATGRPVIIDPRPQHKSCYNGAYIITPNRKEAEEMTGQKDLAAAAHLVEELGTNVLLTRSEDGLSYRGKDRTAFDIPATAQEVFDVTGAGDTVVATLAYFFAAGKDIRTAAELANKAGAIAVGHVGCYQVRLEELL
jgi:D-beta-D-heptose 7-phosphate kinase/D-beta-D-heptose 1-phosphate adenosyltransferase